jgi:hypothetical protein
VLLQQAPAPVRTSPTSNRYVSCPLRSRTPANPPTYASADVTASVGSCTSTNMPPDQADEVFDRLQQRHAAVGDAVAT